MGEYKRNTEQVHPSTSRHSIGYRSTTPGPDLQASARHGSQRDPEYHQHLWSARYAESGTRPPSASASRHTRCKKHADTGAAAHRGYASGTLTPLPGHHQSSLTRTTSSGSAIWGSATLGRSPRLDRHLSGSYSTLGHSHSHRYGHPGDQRPSSYGRSQIQNYGRQSEDLAYWHGTPAAEKWAQKRAAVVRGNTLDVATGTGTGLPPSGNRHGRSYPHNVHPHQLPPDGTARAIGTEMKTEVINVSKYTIPGIHAHTHV